MLARIRRSAEEKDEGFTLIELLVVIIIIGILAAIAIPVFLNQRKKGYDAQSKSDVRNVAIAVESYFTDASPQVYPTLVVNGAEPAVPAASTVYYRKSPATSAITVVEWVNAAGTAVELTGAVGFCIVTTSQSGATFAYNSSLGGVQAKGSTCP